jgi:hypothetical protein
MKGPALSPIPEEPPNEATQWRTLDAEAQRRGFASARALRDWCKKQQVPYIRNGKYNWVSPASIDDAIERLTTVKVEQPEKENDWLEFAISKTKHRRK